MSKFKVWSEHEYFMLQNFIEAGFTNNEIAEMMNRPRTAIAIKSQRECGGNPNYRIRITKHKHLRGPVMRHYVNHSAEECQKKFKITAREFKSILTVGYRMEEFKHLRKETRDHSAWTRKQYLTLLQNSGIRPRSWIARQIGRGNAHSCIKERLERLGVAGRTLNGVTLTSYRALFGKEPRKILVTDAGPGRGKYGATYYKIIPWNQVNQDIKDKYVSTAKSIRLAIDARAMFQAWIFEGRYNKKLGCKLVQYG